MLIKLMKFKIYLEFKSKLENNYSQIIYTEYVAINYPAKHNNKLEKQLVNYYQKISIIFLFQRSKNQL